MTSYLCWCICIFVCPSIFMSIHVDDHYFEVENYWNDNHTWITNLHIFCFDQISYGMNFVFISFISFFLILEFCILSIVFAFNLTDSICLLWHLNNLLQYNYALFKQFSVGIYYVLCAIERRNLLGYHIFLEFSLPLFNKLYKNSSWRFMSVEYMLFCLSMFDRWYS